MAFWQNIFLSFFDFIYTYIHTHFVSYVLVVLLGFISLWILWRIIQYCHYEGGWFLTVVKLILAGIALFLISFLVWFVLFYFHTFLLLDSGH